MKCDKRRIKDMDTIKFLFFIITYIFVVLLFVAMLMFFIFCYNGETIKALMFVGIEILMIIAIIILDIYRTEVMK